MDRELADSVAARGLCGTWRFAGQQFLFEDHFTYSLCKQKKNRYVGPVWLVWFFSPSLYSRWSAHIKKRPPPRRVLACLKRIKTLTTYFTLFGHRFFFIKRKSTLLNPSHLS